MIKLGLEDSDIMPIGTHRGKPMSEVPNSWYVWYYENVPRDKFNRDIHDYIEEKGLDNLKK